MAPSSRSSFLSFAAAVAAAVLLVAAVAPLRAAQASAFPEALDAADASFSDEALNHLSESLTKFISDAKDLAARAVDSLRIPDDLYKTIDEEEKQQRASSRNSLAALLAADPLAGAALLPWPAAAPEASLSRASARGTRGRRRAAVAAAASPLLHDDVIEALEALAAAGADTALFAPILTGEGGQGREAASVVAVDVDEAADGGVQASAVSVSSAPVSPASAPSNSPHLDAALDIQYGDVTAGASAVMRRVAGWVSSLGDSPALVASLSSASPSSSSASSSSSSSERSSLDAARGAFDAAADAIEAVGASLAAALESRPGADDAELDLTVAVDLVGARRESSTFPPGRNDGGGGDNVVDVRIEASVIPGSGITSSMLAEALEGASLDAVVAAGAAGVEVVAARVDVFDGDDDDDEEIDDLSSSSLFSYSRREDAFCLFLGSSFTSGYDRWACTRRAPLSRALAASSLFFAAASAVAAFNALVPVSSSSEDEESESDSEGEEEELDEVVDEEAALFIKPALWSLDSKA